MVRGDSVAEHLPLVVHVATAPGVSGIAIIELFGDESGPALSACLRSSSDGLPPPGRVRLAKFVANGEAIDDVLVASMGPESSTCRRAGWSVYCHGGAAVVQSIVTVLQGRGAVLRTTDDLLRNTEIEPLRSRAYELFLHALTDRASRYFLFMHQGALVDRAAAIFGRMVEDTAGFEAGLDEIDRMLADAHMAIRLGEPLRVLIAGAPNVGKSTLFNALVGQDRVIVSPLAGTTRDLIEETVEIAGYPVTFIDSAGMRGGVGLSPVEQEGIEIAQRVARDVVLFVSDSEFGPEADVVFPLEPDPAVVQRVRSKLDLDPGGVSDARSVGDPQAAIAVSSVSGKGLKALRARICQRWLGPPEGREVSALPYTPEISARFGDLRQRLSSCGPALDGVRKAFLECLGLPASNSWPGSEST